MTTTTAAAPLAETRTCVICGSMVRRLTPSAVTFCRSCGDHAWMARRDLEREGALPKHGRCNLTGVYSDPLVLARVRQMAAGTATPTVAHKKAG